MGEGGAAGTIGVGVVRCAGPAQAESRELRLPAGATVRDALAACGWAIDDDATCGWCAVGVWGRSAALDLPLRDRDRVEIYRALTVDPKEARRARYAQHRARYGTR